MTNNFWKSILWFILAFLILAYSEHFSDRAQNIAIEFLNHVYFKKYRHALDFTYPYAAYFTGNSFNGELVALFGERDILDAWLPFFTVTTDITCSAMRIHDYGSLWR